MGSLKWRIISIVGLMFLCGPVPGSVTLPDTASGQAREKIILSLGGDQFIPKAAIEATASARFRGDLKGLQYLDEVSVIVLADIAYAQLPPVLQASLVQWVELGGGLLVTGGNSSFGLGGYAETPLGGILPLRPDMRDYTNHPFFPAYVLVESHPIFAGVTTASMANFNETAVAGDGTLLLEYRGASKGAGAGGGMTGSGAAFGGTGAGVPGGVGTGGIPNLNIGAANTQGGLQGGGQRPRPLIAERRQGQGTVLAIALDMNATGEWRDRDLLAANAIRYLLGRSALPAQ
jgi:hypothetical protein